MTDLDEAPPHDDADFDEDLDVELPPTVVDLQLDQINGMLGSMRRLAVRIAEYTRIEQQELARLRERREAVVGPMEHRFKALEAIVRQFAVKAWRDEGRSKFPALPNGTIKSSAVQDVIEVNAEAAVDWIVDHAAWPAEEPVTFPPKVSIKGTRSMLGRLESAGIVQRFIAGPGDEVVMIDAGEKVIEQFKPEQVGRWMTVEDGQTVPGITWTPNGDEGVGRNFKIEL